MPASRIATRLTALISRFRRDRRGNIAVIFAFALLPVLSAIGCATDYSLASRMKAKMQSAADAAAVASISENSAGYIAATKMTSDGSVSVGVTDATNIFNGNVPAVGNGYTGDPLKTLPTVTKTGSNLTSVVTFTAQVPTVFMNVARIPVPDHFRQFERERVAAALPRFLSDAGRFGIDGTAVDTGRSPADAGDQSG